MKVRGTQESIPFIEIGKTNVYIRTNVERIEEEEFSGWEYDEEIISIPEYISTLSDKNSVDVIALIITGLMQEIDELKTKVEALEGSI
jgi:hypothetical protein